MTGSCADNPEYAQSTTACCPRDTIPDACTCPDDCPCDCQDCGCWDWRHENDTDAQ